MSLRKRTIILVTLLLVSAVMSVTAIGISSTRSALEEQQKAYGELVARLLSKTTDIVGEFPEEMEDAIGEQMIVEATIAAHMVAMAEKGGYTTEEITQHLKSIAENTELDEFWITDETGHAYLHNIDGIDFTFSGDPSTNPQAYVFWDLITGEKSSVVQDAEPRDVDKQPYKYAGVGGVDKSRIVQVGYNAKKIQDLRDRVSIERLAGLWVDSGEIETIRVVDQNINTVALRPEGDVSEILTALDNENLQRAVEGDETVSYVENNYRKVIIPIHAKIEGGGKSRCSDGVFFERSCARSHLCIVGKGLACGGYYHLSGHPCFNMALAGGSPPHPAGYGCSHRCSKRCLPPGDACKSSYSRR